MLKTQFKDEHNAFKIIHKPMEILIQVIVNLRTTPKKLLQSNIVPQATCFQTLVPNITTRQLKFSCPEIPEPSTLLKRLHVPCQILTVKLDQS